MSTTQITTSDPSLDDLHRRIQSCHDCQNRLEISIQKPSQMYRGPATSRIMAIGQAPSRAALNRQVAFAVNSFTRLHGWFVQAGYQGDAQQLRNEIYLTSLLKCAPSPANRKNIQKCFGLCRGFLWEQLEIIRPHLVLVLGKDASEMLAPDGYDFSSLIGRTLNSSMLFSQELFPPTTENNRWMFLPHPSGLSRTMNDAGVRDTVISALRNELASIPITQQ